MYKLCLTVASLFGGLSVLFGSFGAHSLKGRFSDYEVNVFETACRYQMYHALALFAVALLLKNQQHIGLNVAFFCFFSGTLLFSGSLYALVLTGVKVLGAITPVGGLLLVAGWGSLLYLALLSDI